MIVAAVVCPHPPLLVPEVAAGAATELDDLRAACDTAILRAIGVGLDRLVVVGVGADLRARAAGGSLRPYGVDVHVGGADDESLPLSLTIGAWLLERVGCSVPTEYVGLADDADRRHGADALVAVVAGADRVGVLVMADLSAKLTTASPGYLDERAEGFDAAVVDALASGNLDRLAGLDSDLAEELWCSGVPALVALADAVQTTTDGAAVTARIHYDAAPYGVGYVVAGWQVSQRRSGVAQRSGPSPPWPPWP